jgi:hypothetical protein
MARALGSRYGGRGHLRAGSRIRSRHLAAEQAAPDYCQRHLVLAEPAVLGVRAVALAARRTLVYPHFHFVRLRAHHRRTRCGHGPVLLLDGLHCIGLGVGLTALEDVDVAGAFQGLIAQRLKQGLIRRLVHRRRD